MAIIIDENTRVVVQGLTGREGRFHALRNREYGTKVVAGVTPGKGGADVEGIPVFDTVVEAVERDRRQRLDHLRPGPLRRRRRLRGGRRRRRRHRLHHRRHPGPRRGPVRQLRPPRLPRHRPHRPELPRAHLARQVQHRDHARRDHPAGRPGRAGVPVGHADLPGRPRADPAGHRPDDLRRHRRRSRPGHGLHRLPVPLRGRPRHHGLRDDRRDRRLRRGDGGGLHRLRDDEAGRGLRRRGDRPAGQEDGPRRRHRLRVARARRRPRSRRWRRPAAGSGAIRPKSASSWPRCSRASEPRL